MKRIVLGCVLLLSTIVLFSQTATLRLEVSEPLPNIGENFLVSFYIDSIEYPSPDNYIKSCQVYLEFDNSIIEPVQGPAPFFSYFINLSQALTDFIAEPSSVHFPNELRYVFYTTLSPGLHFESYGGTPHKLWDIEFTYLGGNFEINFGTEPDEGETMLAFWDNSIADISFVDYLSPAANTWNGEYDTNWFSEINWTDGVVPTTEDIVISGEVPNDPVISNGSATCGALTINDEASLTLSPSGSLTVIGATICDGDLYIQSDETGSSGSFIDNGTINGIGNFFFDRDIVTTGTLSSSKGWHYISSPVQSGFTNYDMHDYWVNTWDESNGMFIQHMGNPGIPCDLPDEIILSPLTGWSVKLDLEYDCEDINPGTGTVLDFDGIITNLNTGDKTIQVTFTNNGSLYSGYNLLGNPYPSGIDLSQIVFDENMDGSINSWNSEVSQYDEWTVALGSKILAPLQGFFVKIIENTQFELNNNMRAHEGTFVKEEVDSLVKIIVTGNEMYDETYIRFMEGTSVDYDLHLDGQKMMGNEFSLFTTSGNQELAIDVQPYNYFNVVPMSFESAVPGVYTIEAIQTSDFTELILHNLQTGEYADLLSGSYSFDYNNNEYYFNVFIDVPLNTSDLFSQELKIWNIDNVIHIKISTVFTGEVEIYNMLGQKIVQTTIHSTETQIPVHEINQTYIVKIISDGRIITRKIFVK